MKNRIVLAYTGDLQTSVAIQWLSQRHRAQVVAVTLDLGQGNDLEEVRDRALDCGAVRAHVLDVREEFARAYILPSLHAGALYRDGYPLASALARPLIAKTLVEIARIENATAIAHGSAADDSDDRAIESFVRRLGGDVPVLAPAREWTMTFDELVEYARQRGVPVPSAARHRDRMNLWGRTVDITGLVDDAAEPSEKLYALTRSAAAAPEIPACVVVGFEQGVPVTVNGVPMSLTELIESLTLIAGQHGIGRLSWHHRDGGTTHCEISEAPAAQVLQLAYASVQASVLPPDFIRVQQELSLPYSEIVRSGRWFSPLREALDAFSARVQPKVTGLSQVHLLKGEARVGSAQEVVSFA